MVTFDKAHQHHAANLASYPLPSLTSSFGHAVQNRFSRGDMIITWSTRNIAEEVLISRSPGWRQWPLTIGYLLAIGFVGFLAIASEQKSIALDRAPLLALFLVSPMVVFAWAYFHHMVDEVLAGPDYLVACVGERRALIPMSHILDVTGRRRSRGYEERLTLRLGVNSPFGKIVKFLPTIRYQDAWPKIPMTEFLIKRANIV